MGMRVVVGTAVMEKWMEVYTEVLHSVGVGVELSSNCEGLSSQIEDDSTVISAVLKEDEMSGAEGDEMSKLALPNNFWRIICLRN